MKKFNTNLFKVLLPALFLSVIANAQKLPKIQTASIAAPANIKIDGKGYREKYHQENNPKRYQLNHNA
jgi:hypothetical protein